METKPCISIIVAVYNAEGYMRRCLESIRNQTMRDFEVLLIDDGSLDRSGDICEEYAAADPRFRVFHKENGGVATARQCGVDNALGEYIIHVDPDDWIELNMLELMYVKAVETNSDMTTCNIMVWKDGTNRLLTSCQDNVENIDSSNYNYFLKTNGGALTNKLINHDLYEDIKFPEVLKACEDTYVLLHIFRKNLKISTIKNALYNYDKDINRNSLTANGGYSKSFFNSKMKLLYLLRDEGMITSSDLKRECALYYHSLFYYNQLNQKEFSILIIPHILDIIISPTPIHVKVNLILSAIGFKWIIHPFYVKLKRLVLKYDE